MAKIIMGVQLEKRNTTAAAVQGRLNGIWMFYSNTDRTASDGRRFLQRKRPGYS